MSHLKSICCFAFMFTIPLFAQKISSTAVEFPEHKTFAYSASTANSTVDIKNLADRSVDVCYNAYKGHYNLQAAEVKERFAPYGGARSSAFPLAIIQVAQSFANQIIAQVDTIAKQLTPQQRQQFWSVTGSKMSVLLEEFCRSHDCTSTNALKQHIAAQIDLKKTFG